MKINKLHRPRAVALLEEAQATELAEIFRLMGDQNRLRIILACAAGPICVSDIAEELGIAQSLVSHHLRLLKAARLVRPDRKGKQIYYTVADDHISCVIADMVEHVYEPQETS